MTLLYECLSCKFAHDIEINIDDPKTVDCPQCEKKHYVLLNIFETSKGEKYYDKVGENRKPGKGIS